MPRAFDPHYWVAAMAWWWYGMWKRPWPNESLAAGTCWGHLHPDGRVWQCRVMPRLCGDLEGAAQP